MAEAGNLTDAASAVLGEQHGISPPEALDLVARVAEAQGREVRDVARDVVLIGLPDLQTPIALRHDAGEPGDALPRQGGAVHDDARAGRHGVAAPGNALLKLLVTTESPEQFLSAVADLVVARIEDCACAGITAVHDGSPARTAASDSRAHDVSRAQHVTGEGPCVQAIGSGRPVRVDDLTALPPGPIWLETARAAGVTALVALPLDGVDDDVAAVLTLCATGPRTWSGTALREAEEFAAATGPALAIACRLTEARAG